MNHQELIAAYGRAHGLDGFALNEMGLALLDMGEGLDVYVESRENSLLLHARVGTEPNPDPRLLRHLLAANFFYAGKNHAAMAMDSSNGDILVIMGIDSGDLDLDAFERALDEIVSEAEYWRSLLARGSAGLDELAAENASSDPPAAGQAGRPLEDSVISRFNMMA